MRDRKSEQVTVQVVALLMAARKKKGLSYQALAEAAGIHRTAISLLERGQRSPSLTMCLKLARALEVDLADLIKKAQKTANQ
jgi:transcriptional regulator with XRE-family HTH domain